MSALTAAPNLPLTLFDDDATASSLTALRAGKPFIIDFWTTRCERCPACLDKLDAIAKTLGDKVVFAAICLDDPDFAQELVDEHDWDHITHGGMDLETKEKAKAAWGFSSVPHLVVIGADGATLSSGSALKATAASVEEALAGKENAPAPVAAAPVFSLADDDF